MTISAKVSVPAHKVRHVDIDIEDLGLSEQEWNELSEDQKKEKIEEFVGGFDPVYWEVETFSVSE